MNRSTRGRLQHGDNRNSDENAREVQLIRRERRPKVPATAFDTQVNQEAHQVNFNNNLYNIEIPVLPPAIPTHTQASNGPLTSHFKNFMEMIVAGFRAQLANEHTGRANNETGIGESQETGQ